MSCLAPHEYFDDYRVGDQRDIAVTTVCEDAARVFVETYLPDCYVADSGRVPQSYLCALLMRSMIDGFLLRSSSQGAPGIELLKFYDLPHFGEALVTRQTVLSARVLKSKPDYGIVLMRHDVCQSDGTVCLRMENYILFGRRGYEQTLELSDSGDDQSLKSGIVFERGQSHFLGQTLYSRDEMLAFSHAFDPQPFHVSEEGAKRSLLKVLCASGWQSVVAYDGLRCAGGLDRSRLFDCIRDLKWSIPVLPERVLRFYVEECSSDQRVVMTQHDPHRGVEEIAMAFFVSFQPF